MHVSLPCRCPGEARERKPILRSNLSGVARPVIFDSIVTYSLTFVLKSQTSFEIMHGKGLAISGYLLRKFRSLFNIVGSGEKNDKEAARACNVKEPEGSNF